LVLIVSLCATSY